MVKNMFKRGILLLSALMLTTNTALAAISADDASANYENTDETVAESEKETGNEEESKANYVDENGNILEVSETEADTDAKEATANPNILTDEQKAEIDRLIQERAESDDSVEKSNENVYKPVLMLGADLSDAEKAKVLELFALGSTDDVQTIEIYHEDEVNILNGVVDVSRLGDKAVSSVYIKPLTKGSGISVGTVNIDYVTNETIYNILVTAGAKDVEVKIVAPYKVSGTAAMAGVLRAYSTMTNTKMEDEVIGLAMQQSALVDALGQKYGAEAIEKVFSSIREKAIESSNTNVNSLKEIIRTLGLINKVEFTEDELNQLADIIAKLTQLSIDRARNNNGESKYITEKDFKSEVDYISGVTETKVLNWLFNDSAELPEKKKAKQVKVDNVFDGIETNTGKAKEAPVDENEKAKAEILKQLTEESEQAEESSESTENTEQTEAASN